MPKCTTSIEPVTLSVKDMSILLGVSVRHIYRMVDGGLMPKPLKFGGLNRWHRTAIEDWLAAGAKPIVVRGLMNHK